MVYQVKDKADFDSQLTAAGDKLVVVDFYATWCGPCKMIAPKLGELSTQYEDKAVVIKVDVDECEDIAVEYGVSSMPTFLFFKNGKVVKTFSGASVEKLSDSFAELTA